MHTEDQTRWPLVAVTVCGGHCKSGATAGCTGQCSSGSGGCHICQVASEMVDWVAHCRAVKQQAVTQWAWALFKRFVLTEQLAHSNRQCLFQRAIIKNAPASLKQRCVCAAGLPLTAHIHGAQGGRPC